MSRQYLTVSWEQLHRDAKTLAKQLHTMGPWQGIVAISRGGLIPAAIIAREIECRLVESLCIVTYDDEQRGTPQLIKPASAAGDGTGWLVIDDLVDSGSTLTAVRALLPHAYIATLYAKDQGKALVDCFVQEVPQTSWILFPWDTEPQFIAPLARSPA